MEKVGRMKRRQNKTLLNIVSFGILLQLVGDSHIWPSTKINQLIFTMFIMFPWKLFAILNLKVCCTRFQPTKLSFLTLKSIPLVLYMWHVPTLPCVAVGAGHLDSVMQNYQSEFVAAFKAVMASLANVSVTRITDVMVWLLSLKGFISIFHVFLVWMGKSTPRALCGIGSDEACQ